MGDFLIHPKDNVLVRLENGHKYARCDIAAGEQIIKYGYCIGIATQPIAKGEHVHSHNLKTALSGAMEYEYDPHFFRSQEHSGETIQAYVRKDGSVGIRNDVWIINTVGCVNKVAERLSKETGAYHFSHPYGCSQLGGDHLRTQQTLCGLIRHPNAGGVLVL